MKALIDLAVNTLKASSFSLKADLAFDIAKVWAPSGVYFGFIGLTDVKELVIILGAVVTMVCTILVARSTIRKNSAEVSRITKLNEP